MATSTIAPPPPHRPTTINCYYTHQSMRSALEYNQSLISASGDLLAPLTGKEKFASVGGGHLVAFCRAALAGCRTSEVELQDSEGQVDLKRLQQDASTWYVIVTAPLHSIHQTHCIRHLNYSLISIRLCHVFDVSLCFTQSSCEDAVFRDMLQNGYEWVVINHGAVEQVPRLPHFLQQALNATNTAAAAQSELEVCSGRLCPSQI